MEPRPLSHGYAPKRGTCPMAYATFNGATASQPWIQCVARSKRRRPRSLQWSHGLSAMDTTPWRAMTPRIRSLQWSHGLSAMDTRYRSRPPLPRLRPSMEPRPLSHGYDRQRRAVHFGDDAFNGATASQPWILGIPKLREAASLSLQWSHGLSAMDTCPQFLRERVRNIPSMEPRPLSHGYRDRSPRARG